MNIKNWQKLWKKKLFHHGAESKVVYLEKNTDTSEVNEVSNYGNLDAYKIYWLLTRKENYETLKKIFYKAFVVGKDQYVSVKELVLFPDEQKYSFAKVNKIKQNKVDANIIQAQLNNAYKSDQILKKGENITVFNVFEKTLKEEKLNKI